MLKSSNFLYGIYLVDSTSNSSFTTRAEYEYYETGDLKRKKLEGNQNVDYVYNLAGQLKAINHPSLTSANDPGGDSNDVFGMMIDYYSGDYARTGTPTPISTTADGIDRYDGNIKATRWANKVSDGNPNVVHNAYTYTYNKNNWLTEANYGTTNNSATITPNSAGNYKVTNLTYDANGNLLSLDRNKSPLSGGGNAMDKFTYNYNTATNQLNHVSDAVPLTDTPVDLETQPNNNYRYNSIGQLERNIQDDIEYIYNASGLVTSIKKAGSPYLNIYYDDKGKRVHKEVKVTSTQWLDTYYVRDAAGSVMSIYSGSHTGSSPGINTVNEYPIYGASRLGMYNKIANKNTYEINDHLGNVRAVVSSVASSNSYFDYYPGGMVMPNRQIVGGEQYRYGYQGSFAETDPETGMPAFEARLYDTRINRWLTVDPNNQFHSPYIGMGNYFTNGIDPDGRDVILLFTEGAPYGTALSGHTAVLIGNDTDGWTFHNQTGGADADGGASIATDKFSNINEFYERYGKSGSYQSGVHITTSSDVDATMRQTANDITDGNKAYAVCGNNCQDFARQVIESGGIDLGETQQIGGITWPRAEFINAYNQTDGDLLFFQDARNKLNRQDFRASNLSFFQNVVGLQNLQFRSRFFTNHKPKVTLEVGELQQLPYEGN